MSRQKQTPKPIRLRETAGAAPASAPVIDVGYAELGRKRRILGAIGRAVFWIALAALAGFLIPPIWVLVESLRE